jgi:hypothetical protein
MPLNKWGRLVMLGETDTHVEAILSDADRAGDKPASEAKAAAAWLEDYLMAEGGSAGSAEAKKAGHTAGFAQRTIERAHEELIQSHRVIDKPEGFPRRVFWTLP